MFGRQTHFGVITRERFLQPDSQPVLIAARDQGCARGGTDGGVRVGLQKAHAPGGHAIDIRRAQIRAPVAGNVGIAKIVRQEENDIRGLCGRLPKQIFDP